MCIIVKKEFYKVNILRKKTRGENVKRHVILNKNSCNWCSTGRTETKLLFFWAMPRLHARVAHAVHATFARHVVPPE